MKRVIMLFSILLIVGTVNSQSLKQISLDEAIEIAQKQSLDYKIALNITRSSYWNYQSYKARFLPKFSLNGTLPDYYRSINIITLPNGENNFVSQNTANSSLNLAVSQNLGLTGGRISASSSLRRIDNFGNFQNTAYTSVPFSLSYFQDNIFYNDLKWQKIIEPLRFKESQRGYLESLETISYNTVQKYFELLLANEQLKLDQQNLKNIVTLVKVANERFEIGSIQLNDVLQSKVSLLNAEKAVSNSLLRVETSRQGFVRFLNLEKDLEFKLELPDDINIFYIDLESAIVKAHENRKFVVEFQRRRLEAEKEVEKTKSETGPSINIGANIGLTQRGNSLGQSYENLLRNQSIIIGFNIPIIDWGVNKSNRKRAEANLELENNNIAQEELLAEQEITYHIMKWKMLQEQMEIAKKASELSLQRYNIAKERYTLGSLSYTDFNNAQLDKDKAVTDYLTNLENYWTLYYQIRKLTLFDFETKKNIEFRDFNYDD